MVLICLVAGVAAVLYTNTGSNNTTTNNTNSNATETAKNTSETGALTVEVVATQKGPSEASKGSDVTLNYTVKNNGTETVYNVKAHDQNFYKTLGDLKAGETQSFQYTLHIPSDQEVQEDFGANATVSNPFYVGGFAVTFQDEKGSKYTVNSNSIEIKLL